MTMNQEIKRVSKHHEQLDAIEQDFASLRKSNRAAIKSMTINYLQAESFLRRIMPLLGNAWEYSVSSFTIHPTVHIFCKERNLTAQLFRSACAHAERIIGLELKNRTIDKECASEDLMMQACRTLPNFFLLITQFAPVCKLKPVARTVEKVVVEYEGSAQCLGLIETEGATT